MFASGRVVQVASVLAFGLALLLPAIQWLGYIVELSKVSEELEAPGGWRLIYDFEESEFVEGTISGVKLASKFWKSVYWLSTFEIVGLILAFALAWFLWRSALWHGRLSMGYLALAGIPALIGLSLIPAWLVQNSRLLVETGLTGNPLAVGAGTGESIAPFWIGFLLSLVLGSFMLWSRWNAMKESS